MWTPAWLCANAEDSKRLDMVDQEITEYEIRMGTYRRTNVTAIIFWGACITLFLLSLFLLWKFGFLFFIPSWRPPAA